MAQILFILLWTILLVGLIGIEMSFSLSNSLRFELTKDEHLHGRLYSFFLNHNAAFSNTLYLLHSVALFAFVAQICVSASSPVSLLITFTCALILLVVLTSILFKLMDYVGATATFSFFSYVAYVLYWIVYPLQLLVVNLLTLFGLIDDKNNLFFSINRIQPHKKEMEEDAKDDDDFGDEVKMFQNALDFSKVKLKDAMIPRTEIVAVDIDTSIEDLNRLFVASHFSRILVYKDNIDDILGYVHSADMFDNPKNIESILNPIIVVPELMTANKLLRLFLKQKKSLALVVDEFGGTSGILTIEDVMEEIFGEIEDEHDDDDEFVMKRMSESTFVLSARLEVEAVNDKMDLGLPLREDYVTIGGMLLSNYGFLPKVNDVIVVDKRFSFKVLRTSNTRIDIVRLTLIAPQAKAEA